MPETNETMLEQTFGDLAFSHLRDKSQALLDYLVGFQMLKTEEDGARAVGIFGFEIDEQFYYAPVFFLNGEVRGLDSLYSAEQDLFLPLIEDWINIIIHRRQVELGEPDKRSREQRGVRMPNYTRLKIIPGGTGGIGLKVASSGMLKSESLAHLVGSMSTYRNDAVASLPEALSGTDMMPMFKQAMLQNPKLRSTIEQFYSLMDFEGGKQVKQAEEKRPVVIVNGMSQVDPKELNDEQRKELLNGGVTVIDKRPEVQKSVLYRTESKMQLQNPTNGGMYDVLWADGSVKPAIVVPIIGELGKVFVYDGDGNYCSIAGHDVWVIRQYESAFYKERLEKAGVEPAAVSPNSSAIWLSKDGEASIPFSLDGKVEGSDDITVFTVSGPAYVEAEGSSPYDVNKVDFIDGFSLNGPSAPLPAVGTGRPGREIGGKVVEWRGTSKPCCRVKQVLIRNKKVDDTGFISGNIVYTTDKLVINAPAFTAITLRNAEGLDNTKRLKSSDFGNNQTLSQGLCKAAAEGVIGEIVTWKDGKDLIVRDDFGTHTLNKVGAYKHLILKHGLDAEDAGIVWSEAFPRQEHKYYVKEAADPGFLSFPDIMDFDQGGEMSAYHRSQVPFKTVNQNVRDGQREFYTYDSPFGGGRVEEEASQGSYDPGVGSNSPVASGAPHTGDTVDKASRIGQKDVFDAAALTTLIKSRNPTDLVGRFLPTIISGMDRVGRILFLIYWHYDAFESEYGANKVSSFIDDLKSVFEQLGEVVAFAKKKSLAGDPANFGVGGNMDMDIEAV